MYWKKIQNNLHPYLLKQIKEPTINLKNNLVERYIQSMPNCTFRLILIEYTCSLFTLDLRPSNKFFYLIYFSHQIIRNQNKN
jgi:hypothetical protein